MRPHSSQNTIKARRLKKPVLWLSAKQTKSSELGISTSEAHSPTKVHSLALDPIHWLMNKDRKDLQRIKDENEIYLVVTPERWRRFLGKMKIETISRK